MFFAPIIFIHSKKAVEDLTPVVNYAVVMLFNELEAGRSDSGGECRFLPSSGLSAERGAVEYWPG